MSTEPTASEHPLMLYDGQPISREAAAARWADLSVKPEYAKAFDNNDQVRLTELKDYYMLSRGQVPMVPASSVADVKVQELDRDQLLNLQHDAVLRQRFGLGDEERHQIINKRPILQSEKDAIAEQHARNMRDEAFRERLRRQDPGALRDQYIANAIKVAPLAHSLADIERWNEQFPFKARGA
jgi:hypothetical protein